MTRGYTTFDSLPTFLYIASSSVVAGWTSPQCGSCWCLVYKDAKGVPKNITVTIVDHALNGFYTTSPTAMDCLTGGHAVEYGVVDVTATMLMPVN
ncbi:hypothetical protein BDZ89DRAFT_1072083 [Hymenopellis radicata]|nr:hypothetical protein BDZ89DRAFT_1072083 [Hymenopellis radicata]